MQSQNFYAMLIAIIAIAYGVGQLVGATGGVSPLAAASDGAEPVAVSEIVEESAPVTAPAPPAPPEPKAPIEAPKVEARATPPARPPAPRPASSGLPTEPGMPEDDGTVIPDAKPLKAARTPKEWMASPARGSDTPLVTVIVTSDFQCPVCRRVVKPVEAMIRELGDQVRVEFKHHALESHPLAEDAAAATMAAHKQGKFWAMHDLIFANQRALGPGDLEEHAKNLGLDVEKWRKDVDDPTVRAQIRAESKSADLMGARGTPGFFINGKKQVGWGSYFGFKGMVERELKKAKAAISGGASKSDIYRIRARENAENPDLFIKHYIDGEPPASG